MLYRQYTLLHSLMRYHYISQGMEEIRSLPQGCLYTLVDDFLSYFIMEMLSVTVIGWPCNKGVPAVIADIPLYHEYCSILQLPDTGAIFHNFP